MPENELVRIEAKIDRLAFGQEELRADVHALRTEVVALHTEVGALHTEVGALQTDVGALQTSVHSLHTGQLRHEQRMARLEVLHEDSMDAIKQIAESHAATQILMQKGFADLREAIDRRLDPLEATVRDHSAILRHHNLTV